MILYNKILQVKMKRAICITNGEQGENHAGMQKIGKGLADKGYSL